MKGIDIMAKIIIMADSVAEAKADLEMIEKAKSMGAISGSGSSKDGTMSLEMPRVRGLMAERMAEAYAEKCPCACPCCDEVFSSDYLDEPVEMDGVMVSRFIAEVMGL